MMLVNHQAKRFGMHHVVANSLMLLLELIAVLGVVLWPLGMNTSSTLGGLMHILLVIAVHRLGDSLAAKSFQFLRTDVY